MLGLLAYKALEMFMVSQHSTPVDIYSFVCVVIECLQVKGYLSLHLVVCLNSDFSIREKGFGCMSNPHVRLLELEWMSPSHPLVQTLLKNTEKSVLAVRL